ncbi:MAG: cupin domain-containing protein [Actinobacteria bacterium]|uniref:Unannotated protein n=1 Tax=freshwater metagenome TaxID=449393 RepID=A0A6J7J4G4_9ZZZZ|nr:cupin domain-containing protein [Actinomycetota bacterium]
MRQGVVRVITPNEWAPPLEIVTGGECRPIIWPGMGARERSLHHFTLPRGAGILPLQHPGEAVYYVISGEVEVTEVSEGSAPTLVPPGGMFHVEPGTAYVFSSVADVSVVIGGPCPVDETMYASLSVTAHGGR